MDVLSMNHEVYSTLDISNLEQFHELGPMIADLDDINAPINIA